MTGAVFSFEYEMSDVREALARGFGRLFGAAAAPLAGTDPVVTATLDRDGRTITVRIEALAPRRFGLVALPVFRVRVTQAGGSADDFERLKADFHRTFQRGGG